MQKVGNWVNPGPMLADITELTTQDETGNFSNMFQVGENFKIHVHIIYPETIADVKANYTVRVICVQLAPGVGTGPYGKVYEAELEPNKTEHSLDFGFTASSPGAGPGIYFLVATFDFGEASDFGAYLFGNLFFVS
ncbi:MAG: hypothetical protein ACFFDN_37385 [Candidatus Hodarchaeota archaeon]